jgi:hypothetical protein
MELWHKDDTKQSCFKVSCGLGFWLPCCESHIPLNACILSIEIENRVFLIVHQC